MLRTLFAILLAVCLLAGCAAAPAETIAETTGVDSRQYVYTDGAFCYHIPVVELPGVNAGELNEKLYAAYDSFLQTEVFAVSPEERFWLGLTYEVGQKGDVVCVTVLQRGDCDLDTYDVYYISAATGKELTEEDLFAAFGMTAEEGTEAIRKAMEAYWGQTPEQADPFWLEQKEKTLADSNVNAAKPLITEEGELQFIGEFYSLAGADSYWHRFDQNGQIRQMPCGEHN